MCDRVGKECEMTGKYVLNWGMYASSISASVKSILWFPVYLPHSLCMAVDTLIFVCWVHSINMISENLKYASHKEKSILSFSAAYPKSGHSGSRFSKTAQPSPSPAMSSSSFWGMPRWIPGQMRYLFSHIFWVCSGVSPTSWMYPENFHWKASRRILIRCQNHLYWVLLTQISSGCNLSSLWMFELHTLSLRLSLATLHRKLILAAWIYNFINKGTSKNLARRFHFMKSGFEIIVWLTGGK